MKYATQNECNSFDIGTRVAPFGLNNLEFNGKVGVIESPLESSGQKDVPLHSPPLQRSVHFNYKIDYCYVIKNNACSFFIVLVFLCENLCSESTQYFPVSQRFYSFSSSSEFFVFARAQMDFSRTAIDSPYVCRQVICPELLLLDER